MPTLRNTGTVGAALIQANQVDWTYCVRVDIASPVGTFRYTNRGADIVANIDGTGTQTWASTDFLVGPIPQGRAILTQSSWISFVNLDYTWSVWANSPGLKGAAVSIYREWFNLDGTSAGFFLDYLGEIDAQEHGDRSMMTIEPPKKFTRAAPFMTLEQIDPIFGQVMPSRTETIYWGNAGIRPGS